MWRIILILSCFVLILSCGSGSSTTPIDDTDPPGGGDEEKADPVSAEDISETTVSFDLDGYEFDEPVMTYFVEDTEDNIISIYITDAEVTCTDLVPDVDVNVISLVLEDGEAYGMSVYQVTYPGGVTKQSVNNNAEITILSEEAGEIKGTFEATYTNGSIEGQFVAEECL